MRFLGLFLLNGSTLNQESERRTTAEPWLHWWLIDDSKCSVAGDDLGFIGRVLESAGMATYSPALITLFNYTLQIYGMDDDIYVPLALTAGFSSNSSTTSPRLHCQHGKKHSNALGF
jgi:hypothetical protein